MQHVIRYPWRLLLAVSLVLAATFGGCDCEEDLIEIPEPTCQINTKCKSKQAYRHGKCTSSYCDKDSECCPGTFCFLATHSCIPYEMQMEYECQSDRDCYDRFHDPAQHCVFDGQVGVCSYQACRRSDDCPFGHTCFRNWCVASAPCGGGCAQKEVCIVSSNACHPVAGGDKSCSKQCKPGEIMVVSDPKVMLGDVCCPIECSCAAMPPLQPGVFGRFTSVAVTTNEVLVSAYNETFGDLVVAHYDPQGSIQSLEYVDGVPATGSVGGDIDGPRGGVTTPGPDVGQYTSMVLNSLGEPRIAYYDVDNGDLRLAIYSQAAGAWSVQAVDTEQDAGRYASLIIDPDTDRLRISYMVDGLDNNGQPATAVRIATSLTPEPQTSVDWQIANVEVQDTVMPCTGCGANESCVLVDNAPSCQAETTGCPSSCTGGQLCVDVDGSPACQAILPPDLEGLPLGVGLFTSMAHTDTDDFVVYYDSLQGDLKGARISATAGPQTPVVIDGDGVDGRNSGNVGRTPAIAYDSGTGMLGIAYEDVSTHTLRYYSGSDLQGGTFEVVETGAGAPPGISFIGADAAIGFTADGAACVAYQDASFMDLAFAIRDPLSGEWDHERLLADGSFGFHTSVAVTDNLVYVSSAGPKLDGRRLLANRMLLFIRPL